VTGLPGHIDPRDLWPVVVTFRDGDDHAADRIVTVLTPPVRREIARMLGDEDTDLDDVLQDAMIVGLRYLRAEAEFEGDPVRLVVTIARNRCRDLLRKRSRRPHVELDPVEHWLADEARSALDDLEERERRELLQYALDRISPRCRRLLRQLYVEGLTPEQVRAASGLDTVQGIYYRRSVCLDHARIALQRRLRFGSGMAPASGPAGETGEAVP